MNEGSTIEHAWRELVARALLVCEMYAKRHYINLEPGYGRDFDSQIGLLWERAESLKKTHGPDSPV